MSRSRGQNIGAAVLGDLDGILLVTVQAREQPRLSPQGA
jgi:hypothetical protein